MPACVTAHDGSSAWARCGSSSTQPTIDPEVALAAVVVILLFLAALAETLLISRGFVRDAADCKSAVAFGWEDDPC